jgi:radical SAM superfamily enzyme YgiQ (UPF0313 family)
LLSACLKEKDIEVDLFDATCYKTEEISFEEKRVDLLQIKSFNVTEKGLQYEQSDIYGDLIKKINKFKPNLIGITLVENTYDLGMALLAKIEYLKVPIIAGGVYVTLSPEQVIANNFIDMICVGEGEEALVELCQRMINNEDYSNVKNLWVKKGDRIIKNELRSLTDINKLPFIDYDIFGRDRLSRPMFGKTFVMIHVEIDRGCPNSCTYCCASQLRVILKNEGCGTYHRRKNIDRLMAEMKFLKDKYNPDYVNFNSETFLARPTQELKKFAESYKEINLPFWCQTRPETLNEERVKILKEMGCECMQFGIEHGNDKFRKEMLNRLGTSEQIINNLKIVEKFGIPYTVNNIIGFPGETRELIFDTIEINRQINPRTINCFMACPYRGTVLYQYCIENGYLSVDSKVNQVIDGIKMNKGPLTYDELKGLQRTFPLYVRFPKSEWPRIRMAEKFDEKGNSIFEEYKKEYQKKFF